MRPRVLRRCIVLAGIGGMLAAATITTAVAKADPVTDYVLTYAPAVCSTLDKHPSVAGVESILQVIVEDDGFTATQAGEIVGRSVIGWCPSHMPEVQAFVAKYTDASTVRT